MKSPNFDKLFNTLFHIIVLTPDDEANLVENFILHIAIHLFNFSK